MCWIFFQASALLLEWKHFLSFALQGLVTLSGHSCSGNSSFLCSYFIFGRMCTSTLLRVHFWWFLGDWEVLEMDPGVSVCEAINPLNHFPGSYSVWKGSTSALVCICCWSEYISLFSKYLHVFTHVNTVSQFIYFMKSWSCSSSLVLHTNNTLTHIWIKTI